MLIAAIIIAVVFIALGLYIQSRPDQFRIERSTEIHAPAERVFTLLEDFHRWQEWSPWEELDPQLERKYSGATSGVGAIYDWSGNKKIGAGRMEILETSGAHQLAISLEFYRPMRAHNSVHFVLLPQEHCTQVRWSMEGNQPFMGKLMGLVCDMDKMVGKDFEKGLSKLKALSEKP